MKVKFSLTREIRRTVFSWANLENFWTKYKNYQTTSKNLLQKSRATPKLIKNVNEKLPENITSIPLAFTNTF